MSDKTELVGNTATIILSIGADVSQVEIVTQFYSGMIVAVIPGVALMLIIMGCAAIKKASNIC